MGQKDKLISCVKAAFVLSAGNRVFFNPGQRMICPRIGRKNSKYSPPCFERHVCVLLKDLAEKKKKKFDFCLIVIIMVFLHKAIIFKEVYHGKDG